MSGFGNPDQWTYPAPTPCQACKGERGEEVVYIDDDRGPQWVTCSWCNGDGIEPVLYAEHLDITNLILHSELASTHALHPHPSLGEALGHLAAARESINDWVRDALANRQPPR